MAGLAICKKFDKVFFLLELVWGTNCLRCFATRQPFFVSLLTLGLFEMDSQSSDDNDLEGMLPSEEEGSSTDEESNVRALICRLINQGCDVTGPSGTSPLEVLFLLLTFFLPAGVLLSFPTK